ncbi:MAG TPA: alpha-1,2-fucosyltransferase [Rariglobus sp.]|nr:alpha-1,2-fucosyltransferase [Rariglobus sp.]
MPPVVTLVKGGLGNQLFCYAAARALALRLGRPLALDITTGYRRDDYGRSYRLGRFPIQAEIAGPEWCLGGDTHSWSHRLARNGNKLLPLTRRSYLAEKRRHGINLLTMADPPSGRRVYLNGYWQDERFFEASAGVIRDELTPPAPVTADGLAVLKRIEAVPFAVMVHVRRVRYSPKLGADYYHRAVEQCLAAEPGARFFVFGDDQEWARATIDFHGAPVEFVANPSAPDELEDFSLMTRCGGAIVANSSFSWWGAWLGQASKRVWTPANAGFPLRPAAGWVPVENEIEAGSAKT